MSYAKLNVLHWHAVDDQSFPLQILSLPLLQQRGALNVGQQHEVDQAARPTRRLLLNAPDARSLGIGASAAFGINLVRDQPEQRRLASAVASDKADLCAKRNRRAGMIKQEPRPEPISEVFNIQHGVLLRGRAQKRKWRVASLRRQMLA